MPPLVSHFNARLQRAERLIAEVYRRNTIHRLIFEKAWTHVQVDDAVEREKAMRLCRECYQLAADEIDCREQGIAAFFLGVIGYLGAEEDWEQSTLDCDEAASIFRSQSEPVLEATAFLAIAYISETECAMGINRWHRGLRMYDEARRILEKERDGLLAVANPAYENFSDEYTTTGAFANINLPNHLPQLVQADANDPPAPAQSTRPGTNTSDASSDSVEQARRARAEQAGHRVTYTGLLLISLGVGILFCGLTTFLVTRFSDLALAFLVGFIVMVFATAGFDVLIFWIAGQLRCQVLADQAAVMQYRDGNLSILATGSYWVIPWVEYVRAFVSLEKIALTLFPCEIQIAGASNVIARVAFVYQIERPNVLIEALNPNYVKHIIGIPCPVTWKQVEPLIKVEIQKRAIQSCRDAVQAADSSQILQNQTQFRRDAALRLRGDLSHLGIRLEQRPEIALYVR